MSLHRLKIQDLRNLRSVRLEPSPYLNVLFGTNGSGKTSVLEAIYLLGRGRSFREGKLHRVIRSGCDSTTVYGEVEDSEDGRVPVGIKRDRQGFSAKIQGRAIARLGELSTVLPALVLTPASHRLVEGGSRFRRQFVDWGVFHVEHRFYPLWQRYMRALRQRNAGLRSGWQTGAVDSWDAEIAQAGEALAELRQEYLQKLLGDLPGMVARLMDLDGVSVTFRQGWPEGERLGETLRRCREGDRRVGHTRYGPHRADIALKVAGVPANERLSRGQQKLLVAAMVLTQARIYREQTGRRCVLLIDDLPAELDDAHRGRLMRLLVDTGAQTFVTTTEAQGLPTDGWPNYKMFHVEHGQVREVI